MSYYPTNQTEKQWQVIKNMVEPQGRSKTKKRKAKQAKQGKADK